MNSPIFDRFRYAFESATPPDAQDPRLLMDTEPAYGLRIYYSPFEYLASSPRLVLVGITPGKDQAAHANRAIWQEIRNGASVATALRAAKFAGAFRGEPIRSNLLRQLEDWRVHEWLGFKSAEEALDSGQEQGLVHLTSSVRFPVFKGSRGYDGSGPEILSNPLLRRYFVQFLSEEARRWSDALVIPLGKKPLAIVTALCNRGQLRKQNVCEGMLHPSRNNLPRLNWILSDRKGKKPGLTDPSAYDAGRESFQSRYIAP